MAMGELMYPVDRAENDGRLCLSGPRLLASAQAERDHSLSANRCPRQFVVAQLVGAQSDPSMFSTVLEPCLIRGLLREMVVVHFNDLPGLPQNARDDKLPVTTVQEERAPFYAALSQDSQRIASSMSMTVSP